MKPKEFLKLAFVVELLLVVIIIILGTARSIAIVDGGVPDLIANGAGYFTVSELQWQPLYYYARQ